MALRLAVTKIVGAFIAPKNTPLEENSRKLQLQCETEKDRISELPDKVIVLILSNLNVKDAIKTRLLSRRWRRLSLLYLNESRSEIFFDSLSCGARIRGVELQNLGGCECSCQQSTPAFMQNVNKFLNEYKGPNMSYFGVSFCLDRKFASHIDRWITYAIKLGVEQLEIRCSCNLRSKSIPNHELYAISFERLSESSELKWLRLFSCKVKLDFSGQFHSLTSLHLFWCPLDPSILLFILSRCCNLEELHLFGCLCPAVLSFRAPFLRLKSLTIFPCVGLKEIELSATDLTAIEVCSGINVVFSSVPNLENVYLGKAGDDFDLVYRTLNDVPRLQWLSVITSVKLGNNISSLALLSYLKKLEFSLSGHSRHDIRKVIHVLNACPRLQILNLSLQYDLHIQGQNLFEVKEVEFSEERTMMEIPERHLTELKEVELSGFIGTENQVELALYLLKNAVALERIVITNYSRKIGAFGKCYYWEIKAWSDWRHTNSIQQLQGKATSKGAQVIFHKGKATKDASMHFNIGNGMFTIPHVTESLELDLA